MCNFKHTDKRSKVQAIPESGTGWKIFEKLNGKFLTLCAYRTEYRKTDGRITWDPAMRGDGFCFFSTKTVATKCLKKWEEAMRDSCCYVVMPIRYSGGTESHLEHKLIANRRYRLSLCKSFEIL